jgi:RNA polymerase sigma-70 factor (ECF subfamily)
LDDADLVARVLAGEREPFHVLFRRHTAPLFATLRSTLGNRDDAREVLQETWLRAFEGLSTLREPERLRSWLLAIALNLARGRRRRWLDRPAPADELPPDPAVEDQGQRRLEDDETLDALRRSIAGLPARQREVVDLRVNHELSHAEIARLLGITEEASRASYYQALRRLREGLGVRVQEEDVR